VEIVDPADELGGFGGLDIEVEYESGLAAPCQHAMQLQVMSCTP